jgi:hypothetical protein
MRLFNYLLAASVVLSACVGPALADPHHGWHGNRNGNHRAKHWKKKYRKSMRRNFNNWNDERSYYSSHWNSPNAAARARYDAQMRENWLRYKNNNYNGTYSWSTYNDPRFIDYLHNNNPSLLTNIRNVIGF